MNTVLLVCTLILVGSGLVAPQGGRGKYPKCPKVRYEVRPRTRTCTTKYECQEVCEMKKKCRTKYEYKCTDYKRRKCEDVWQNQCNGKRPSGRKKREDSISEDLAINRINRTEDISRIRNRRQTSNKRRFFQSWTNTVYDQSDLPQSDLPFASPSKGQVFDFKKEPKSKRCWKKVRQCRYKKYKSSCRNVPQKVCDDKLSQVCKKKCKNVYYCTTCPDKKPTKPKPTRPTSKPKPKPTKKPVGPKPTRPKPTSKPKPKPTKPTKPTKPKPSPPGIPPPGIFIVSPPSPPPRPSTFDVIVDAKKQSQYKTNKDKPR